LDAYADNKYIVDSRYVWTEDAVDYYPLTF